MGTIIPRLKIILVLPKILLDNNYCTSAKLTEKPMAPLAATPQLPAEAKRKARTSTLSECCQRATRWKTNQIEILFLKITTKIKNLVDEFEGKREREEGKKINELETIIQTGISEQQKENRL